MDINGIEWTPELEKELYTPEEIKENTRQARLICERINAGREQNINQKEQSCEP